jgi:outer membrane receptor protein involved in Fe transport
VAFTLAIITCGAADAQTAENATAQASVSDQSDPLQEVLVTGSRIARGGFEEPTPVTVIGAGELEQKGIANVADLLSVIPAFRQTAGTGQAQRSSLQGGGQSLLDLRGLGPNRTLVLVDGQRVVPTNTTGTVDVNLIPAFLIDRVEVVTGGASAAYGSDAVAGVVNFVLRRKLNGIQFGTSNGESEYGDNIDRTVNFAAGHDFAEGRLHVLIGADYDDSGGVGPIYARSWGAREPGIFGTGAARPAGVPSQLFATTAELSNITSGGLINTGPLKGTAFGPGGTPTAFDYGQVFGTWMIGTDSNYRTNTFGHWPLHVPIERVTSLARVGYDVSDHLMLFATASYGQSQEHGFGSYHQWPSIIIATNNPFIPAATKARMAALKLASITIGRNSQDINDGFHVENSDASTRFSVGARGDLPGSWTWDTYLGWGRTRIKLDSPNLVRLPNFFNAVYAVRGPNGAPQCGPVATNPNLTAAQKTQVEPGCVPINLFGYGSPSQAAIDYVTGDLINRWQTEQKSAALNVQGSPLSTWAGAADVAAGLEWRRDSIDSAIDPGALLNEWYTANALPLVGSNTVREVYGETVVPLLKDLRFAKSVAFNGAVRHTDYRISGAVTTWKAGLTYDVNEAVRFRSTRSRDIRAPTLSELFTRNSAARAGLVNPINGQSGTAEVDTAGNLSLVPEIADTTTVGVVWKPELSALHGLTVSLDYYDIKVRDVVTTLTAQQILTACSQGIQQYCSAVTFDNSVFGVRAVVTQPFNASELNTNGFDLEIAYLAPIERLKLPGNLAFRGLLTHVTKLQSTAANGVFDYAGVAQSGVPKWAYKLSAIYDLGRLSVNADAHGLSAIKYDVTLIGPDDPNYSASLPNSINDNTFPSATYVDLGLRYQFGSREKLNLQLSANVDNAFNREPPQFAAIGINSGGNPYDLIGRTYHLGIRLKY